MEQRGQQHHKERLGEAMREELSTILAGELGDPRIGLVSITELVMGEGGRSMRVFVSVTGDEEEAKQAIEGLRSASGYIRHELAENLSLRHPPEITFHLDKSQQYGARIDELLKRTHRKAKNKKSE
ncbi:MAG TPA: 30S ribosome-binding factor RbfA [Clostridia bacterium]|nr:30S ribosome-binding factor RbfA [Clostridia bacterium]